MEVSPIALTPDSFAHFSEVRNSPVSKKSEEKPTQDQAERATIEKLRARDREVRAHEQAHAAAAGGLAKGGPSYTYQLGPDGKQYAIGGEVNIDTSPVAGDPEATIRKAQRIRAAALAPADPSPQDRAVAASANTLEAQARQEIQQEKREEREEDETVADSSPSLRTPIDLFV